MICGIYPPTPPENVDAALEAMRDFRGDWWEGDERRTMKARSGGATPLPRSQATGGEG